MGRSYCPAQYAASLILSAAAFCCVLPCPGTESKGPTMTSSSQPAHTNRLIQATSPYLLQHAHNPVDWYPWGAEALERARRENKPIFLSIGYSACHWCHVMERESFENDEIARILNEHFVSIKVDREERPDLDEIYMNATVIANQGQGGWPMSVFLTPTDQKPFFAGTYFPPDSRWGRPGFKDLLLRIADLWDKQPDQVREYGENLANAVRQFGGLESGEELIPRATVTQVVDALARAFDPNTGGLLSGSTNKFPPSMSMTLMLREYWRSRSTDRPREDLLALVELTLDHMARGGIYDHLGGGIARYSTDPEWLVPHFEKMLYDQALVASVYLEAHQVTGKKFYADVARGIFDYVLRDLQSPEGGFYSARDADSEGVEGKFYVWSKQEVLDALGEEVGKLFCSYYDVTESGNWEGHNILHVERDLATVAKLQGLTEPEAARILQDARRTLFDVREKRVHPGLDDKILTSWNGLMIASLARGGRVTGETRYTQAAVRAADFILARMTENGRLLRTYRAGKAHISAYLDDYAFLTEGLLELYETTFDFRFLSEAVRLTEQTITLFWDRHDDAFFFTAGDAEQLFTRTKDSRDGAIPSGNSVMLTNLLRLAELLDRDAFRQYAEQTMKAFAGSVQRSPHGLDRFLQGVDFYHAARREIVLVGPQADPRTRGLIDAVRRVYDPWRVVLLLDPTSAQAADWQDRVPLLAGKSLVDGSPAAYVCRNRTCRRPVTEPADLVRELQAN